MDIIYLVYGLSFLVMGVVIVVRHEDDSRLELAGILWLLATFGFIHGLHEWMDLWRVVRGGSPALAAAQPVVLLVSYLPLFEFGRRLTRASLPDGRVRRSLGIGLYGPVLAGVFAGTLLSEQPMLAMDIWSRYLIGFTATLLTGIGFCWSDHSRALAGGAAREIRRVRLAAHAAGIAFLAYALFGGLIVPAAPWGPAAIVNQDSWLAAVHLPVQFFRALCAAVVAASVTVLLEVFHLEAMQRLRTEVFERRRSEIEQRLIAVRLQLVLDTSAEGIIGVDNGGRVTFANRAATDPLGWRSADTPRGMPIPDVLGHHLSNGRPCSDNDEECGIHSTLADGKTRRVANETFLGNNAMARPVEYVIAPLVIDGEIAGAVIAFHDITDRIRSESALARSNAELEQFAYAVSHDLRQPLRMVHSYLQLLERHLAETIDEDGRGFIDFASDGAARMDRMLVALLEYSRVGHTGEPMAVLDSREALEEALWFLSPAIGDAAAEITVAGDWPSIHAGQNDMVRLFQNLIGNAVKYRLDDHPPRIVVSVAAGRGEWVFSVRDDGIGIDPTQIDRLFRVFSRLHGRDRYDGSGVGLAVCRKIVERHGGRIWVESEGEGKGSVFHFTLPMSDATPSGHDEEGATP